MVPLSFLLATTIFPLGPQTALFCFLAAACRGAHIERGKATTKKGIVRVLLMTLLYLAGRSCVREKTIGIIKARRHRTLIWDAELPRFASIHRVPGKIFSETPLT